MILVRHGRTAANVEGGLVGRTPGVHLDERGTAQAKDVAERLAALPFAVVVSSPLERCVETAEAIAAARPGVDVSVDGRLTECGYGDWTGQQLKALAKGKLWRTVQMHPSAVTFPGDGGEAMRDMQARAVAAIREWDAQVASAHGAGGLWVACSHGDVIKSIVADALGLHLDLFQRIVVDPGSATVITYTELRPFLVRLNDTGSLAGLLPAKRGRRRRISRSDAEVGGGAGAS